MEDSRKFESPERSNKFESPVRNNEIWGISEQRLAKAGFSQPKKSIMKSPTRNFTFNDKKNTLIIDMFG